MDSTSLKEVRVLRADARRSRAHLLAVATAAFAEAEEPTLKAIAGRAEVGIGTLFRHFPTREALVEAIYETELARLCDGVTDLLRTQTPDLALRTWMTRWGEFVQTKRGMGRALQHLAAAGTVSKSDTGTRLTTAIQLILDADRQTGTLRHDINAEDITTALTGILLATGPGPDLGQTRRLLDLLMNGLTPTPRPSATAAPR